MKRFWVGSVLAVLVVLGLVPDAGATVMFSGSDATRSAEAKFKISGTTLTVMLTNTDTAAPGFAPSDVLTGLFFNLGTSALTPQSATVGSGSIAQASKCTVPATCSTATNVGGEWGYSFGPVTKPAGFYAGKGVNQGIASAGYLQTGLPSNAGNFGGANLDSNAGLAGLSFGIVPTGFVDGSGNGGVDNRALIKGSTTFVLTLPKGLKESDIANVYFTYGTKAGEGTIQGKTGTSGGSVGSVVPEPSSLALLGGGLAMAAAFRRRRRA